MQRLISYWILTLLLSSALTFIWFNVKYAECAWTGTVYIKADGRVLPQGAPVTNYNNITYTLTDNITSTYHGIVVERDNVIIDGAGFTITKSGGSYAEGIRLVGRSNVTIKNVNIRNFDFGVNLYSSSNNVISGNNITDSYYGIYIGYSSHSNIVRGNNIRYSDIAVTIIYSSNNVINRNNITNNFDFAVVVGSSPNNTLSRNNIVNNQNGINVDSSSNIIIYGNNISYNMNVGVRLGYSNNTLIANNITNNYRGVYLQLSSNNKIYHNNFIDNTMKPYVYSSENVWDNGYPSGGNFWSDYNGTDQDGDGIGDTAYVINAQNIDRYPLMYPFVIPKYNLTITTTAGGTTTPPPGVYTYENGTIANVTAIPEMHYALAHWELDGVNVGSQNPIEILITANHTLHAVFVYDDIPPEISEPLQDPPPDDVQPLQEVRVWVNVSDSSGVKNVTLWYSVNGTEWIMVNMTAYREIYEALWGGTIPGYEDCTWVAYKIMAYDNAGNNATRDNNGYCYEYHVVPEFSSLMLMQTLMILIAFAVFLVKKRKRLNHIQPFPAPVK